MTTATAIPLQNQGLPPVYASGGHPLGSGMESVSMGTLMPGHTYGILPELRAVGSPTLALGPCLRRRSHDSRLGDATYTALGAGTDWLVKTLT